MGQIKNVKIDNAAASGDLTLLAAANTTQVIRVLGYTIVAKAAADLTWKSGATALSGAMGMGANGVLVAPTVGGAGRDYPHLQTAPGADLKLGISAASQVGGHLTVEVLG